MQYADQDESVHGLYQMQNGKELVVSTSETFEKKSYHQCIVKVYHYFQRLSLISFQFSIFITISTGEKR